MFIILLILPLIVHSPSFITNTLVISYSELLLKLVEPHEGRKHTIYKDPAGYKATGIGHLITHSDKLNFPLLDKQIDSIFYADIGKKLKIAIKYYPIIKDSSKLYAIAWFAFVYGEANFKYLKHGIPLSNEIDNWCYYKKDSIMIKSNNLKRILNDINRVYKGEFKTILEWVIK